MQKNTVSIVVPNWNGRRSLEACLDSLVSQTIKAQIIVVDNGSVDDSVDLMKAKYKDIVLLEQVRKPRFCWGR